MKISRFCIIFVTLSLSLSQAFAKCDVNNIDMASGENRDAFMILSEKSAHFKNKSQYIAKMDKFSSELPYSQCKDAMVWRKLRAKNSTKVYTALISVEDTCDGGNSTGVLYFNQTIVGTIEDSIIYCQ